MYAKSEFSTVKGSICNVPIEVASICSILPRPALFSGLIIVKLKQNHKCKGHVYFEQFCPHVIYQELAYLKSRNQYYGDIFITKGLSSEDMFIFSNIEMLKLRK